LVSLAGLTGAITHRADNHYHPVLEEAVDYRDYSDGLETVDRGYYSNGSLFDLQNGPSSGAPLIVISNNIGGILSLGDSSATA
jgi:hypothetical protein